MVVFAAEADALAIDERIQARHMPHGAIADPAYPDPDSTEILNYTRCGDSAIWTGHYLAAESYRYAVTRSPQALDNVRRAIDAIRRMLDVTRNNLLPRCAFPANSPWAAAWISEEGSHGTWAGIVDGEQWQWIGNTSRDQYLGVFFGLTATWNVVDLPDVRGAVRSLTVRMLDHLESRAWTVVMPDGGISTTFAGRADQRLMMLKLGRRVDGKYDSTYRWQSTLLSAGTNANVGIEVLDPYGTYFKFNLDHITFYGLLSDGDSGWTRSNYERAFTVLRNTTDDHANAFFDVIERAVKGPNAARDTRIRELLDRWLSRPTRDFFVDLRGKVRECGDRACDPVPVEDRVLSDFVWQRSPFQLTGGGSGRVENAGIDYILPYWMARYYGVSAD